MDGPDFNWKKSRAHQRRKEKKKKDFSHRNKSIQQDQETVFSDKTGESPNFITPSETDVSKDKKFDVERGFNVSDVPSNEAKDSEEKPVVDFSNLKRETEEIEKLIKRNQYEISSSWERYVRPENKENLAYDSEEPADILKLLQLPSSYGGHFLLKEEQDWAATSKMLLSGCFTLDLKRVAQGLSCIPFYVRHGLPENIFSVEEIEQMTCGLTKRHEDYFRLVKEETVTDKNRNVGELSSNKNGNTSAIENHYDHDNMVDKNNTFSLEKCLESVVIISKTEQSPAKEDGSFKDESKTVHTVDDGLNKKLCNAVDLKYVKNTLPVPVIACEIFDSHSSPIREYMTPDKTIDSMCKIVVNDKLCVKERKGKADSPVPSFSSSHMNNERESNRIQSSIHCCIKECEDTSTSSKPVSLNNTTANNKEDNAIQKPQKLNCATDELDFLLSLQESVKKPSSVSGHQKYPGSSYMPAPKVTTVPNKIEKDESLEDWLDSVLNG